MKSFEALAILKPHMHIRSVINDVRQIETVESKLGTTLPADYKSFQMAVGGPEMFQDYPYYLFYTLNELVDNRAEPHPEGLLEFANDNSMAYAFDLQRRKAAADYPVVCYPLCSSEVDEVEYVAQRFESFLREIIREARDLQD